MRIVYLAPDRDDPPGPALRTGEAGCVRLNGAGEVETPVELRLSGNSTHALLGHGVIEKLNQLEILGELGSGREVLIPQAVLDAARSILYAADRHTYGGRFEFAVARRSGPEPTEYRLRIDNREFQATLARLQYLLTMAGREGRAVWLRI